MNLIGRLARLTTAIIAAGQLLTGSFAQAAPATSARASGIEASVEPRYAQYRVGPRTVLAPEIRAALEAAVVKLEPVLAAAPVGSAQQVSAAASLASAFTMLEQDEKAIAAARTAIAGAAPLWATDLEIAAHAYSALANLHAARGYLLDSYVAASRGEQNWRRARGGVIDNPADYAGGSMLIELARQAVLANTLLGCGATVRSRPESTAVPARQLRPDHVMREVEKYSEALTARQQLRRALIQFPKDASQDRLCSYVVVGYLVDAEGAIVEPRIVASTGSRPLERQALSAVSAIVYEPRSGAKLEWMTLCVVMYWR